MTEPFRFLHAADLFVSGQLRQTGQFPNALTTSIATATEKAWENVVSAAVDAEVDFVLISGSCFDSSDPNPRAEFLLRDGFDLLESHGIRTFVLPGEVDPQTAWQAFADPTENVTLFYDATAEPVAFLRQGKVVATFAPAQVKFDTSDKLTGIAPQQSPFCIGYCTTPHPMPAATQGETNKKKASNAFNDILTLADSQDKNVSATTSANDPVNYLAWSGSSRRQEHKLTNGMAHHPGPVQGLSSKQSGPSGCTIVDVDSSGQISHRFVSTASVRWENRYLELNAESTRTDVIQQMSSQLLNEANSATESICLVEWNVAGVGSLYQSLSDPNTQDEISTALQKHLHQPRVEFVNRIHVIPQTVPQDIGQGSNESLFTEFLESLSSEEFDVKKQLSSLLEGNPGVHNSTSSRLDDAHLTTFDSQRIELHARQLGETWFRKTHQTKQA